MRDRIVVGIRDTSLLEIEDAVRSCSYLRDCKKDGTPKRGNIAARKNCEGTVPRGHPLLSNTSTTRNHTNSDKGLIRVHSETRLLQTKNATGVANRNTRKGENALRKIRYVESVIGKDITVLNVIPRVLVELVQKAQPFWDLYTQTRITPGW